MSFVGQSAGSRRGAVDRDGVERGAARARRRSATEDNDEAMMCVRCQAG